MNRRAFLAGCAGAAAACSRDKRPRLNVWNWSNYVAPDTIPSFEREFNVRVRYAVYESNEEMLAKAMGGNSGWDVVFPSHYYIRPMRENALLAKLDHALLRNLDRLESAFRAPAWDPNLECSVPYMWNGTGILYNKSLTPAPRKWADMWSTRMAGRLTMLDDPAEVLGACLKKLGHSWNCVEERELRAAQREAIAQKRVLRAYLNAEVRDQVVAGDVLAAQIWSTNAQQAMDASPALAFAYPLEGFGLYMDNAVILRESKRQELAHRFLDYLLRPQVAADIAAAVKTATANRAARALLPAGIRENPVLFPSGEVLARGEWAATLPSSAQRLRDRLWTEIKSA